MNASRPPLEEQAEQILQTVDTAFLQAMKVKSNQAWLKVVSGITAGSGVVGAAVRHYIGN
jgi:hypothetical protein